MVSAARGALNVARVNAFLLPDQASVWTELLEYAVSTIKKEPSKATSAPEQPRDRRFQLRATAREETLIKVAAERRGVDATDFIISAAREKAEETLTDQTRFVLNDEQWTRFTAALDRPPRAKPRLRKLFSEPHVAKRRS